MASNDDMNTGQDDKRTGEVEIELHTKNRFAGFFHGSVGLMRSHERLSVVQVSS